MKSFLRYAIATLSLVTLYPIVALLGVFLLPREICRAVKRMEAMSGQLAVKEAVLNVQTWPPSTNARSGQPTILC